MIYTIGREDIYEDYIKNDKNAAKRKGGSVWETYKDAQWYINKNELYDEYKVYGVEANWEFDTEIEKDALYRSLKRDAKLIKIALLSTVFPWVKSES